MDENGALKDGFVETPSGHVVNVKAEKNKVTTNDRKLGDYTLNYHTGVDLVADNVDMGIMLGLIVQAGAWFTMPLETGEALKVQGKSKISDYLREHPEELEVFNQRVYDALMEL
jgi:recombination protein RecA